MDRRVIKTKRAIRNAFVKLLSEKDIKEITIKDIAETADINRKTFYNYYSGVYQVIDEIENELVTAFEQALKNVDFERDMKDPYLLFAKLTAIINSDMDFYSHLMRKGKNLNLVAKIIETLKGKLKETFASQIEIEEHKLNIIADFTISGMVAVYREWFNSDHSVPIEELSREVSILTFSGLNGILNT